MEGQLAYYGTPYVIYIIYKNIIIIIIVIIIVIIIIIIYCYLIPHIYKMTLATLHVHNYDTHQRIHDVRIYFMMSGTTVVLMSTEFAKSCKVMQTS